MRKENSASRPVIQRLLQLQNDSARLQPESLSPASWERQLRQSLEILNLLINENAHRPDAIHLLRKTLQDRAKTQFLKQRDQNSLSG